MCVCSQITSVDNSPIHSSCLGGSRLFHICHHWNSANIQVEWGIHWQNVLIPSYLNLRIHLCFTYKEGRLLHSQGQWKVRRWVDGLHSPLILLLQVDSVLGEAHYLTWMDGWMEERAGQRLTWKSACPHQPLLLWGVREKNVRCKILQVCTHLHCLRSN